MKGSETEALTAKQKIAKRVALEIRDGDVVNLGIGLPTLIPAFLDPRIDIQIQSENGFIGLTDVNEQTDKDLVNAGGQPTGLRPGGSYFDSSVSFALIRGGHVDVSVLGGLEVDEQGNLANWMVPGKMVPGMGGAMDLVTGAKKVIIAMEHCAKDGAAKIVKRCTLPLTAVGVVSMIVTELAVFRFAERGLELIELADGVDLDTVKAKTTASFAVNLPQL
ncbi:3-oxoacid CoA-transferase subunit B [Paenibacillus macerans]|uniref:3-oxoacid CoA-transferase subunit B n=1 Tax=Paenibacillus macerans TaxID=44252 RepID=UPI00255993C2|nr:3-oxoacid CoA-transferase subunit B [Paenibacillus macerans]